MVKKKKTIISFVGESFAKKNFMFYFNGIRSSCPPGCKLYHTCMKNLTAKNVYKINKVMDKKMECPYELHEEKMQLVEVIIPNLIVSMENKDIYLGSIGTYQPISCDKKDCEYYQYCVPSEYIITEGTKVKILDEEKKIKKCPKGLHLTIVSLEKRD